MHIKDTKMRECCKTGPYISHFKKLSAFAVLLVGMRGMQVLYVSADGNNILCNVLRDCGSHIRHRIS